MKQLKLIFISAALSSLFIFSQCKKKTEEPQLPPETTTGAMTFGCKINGKVFVPKDGRGKPGLYVKYVYLGPGVGEGWFLNIPATDWTTNPSDAVVIQTDSLLVEEARVYEFMLTPSYQRIKGTFYTVCDIADKTFAKTTNDNGTITIKKFDQINRILSGTFFYSATNISTGEKINVTDGRFDIRY